MKKTKTREFDFNKCRKTHIALAVGYFGWSYHGVQGNAEGNGIENHLIAAFIRMKLLESEENLMLTRCGRTDKCVSAAKQIYGMYILIKEEKLDSTDFDISQILSPLNCILPDDIFAYSICHIADGEEFDARFGCSSRRYKYFFSNDSINIKAMSEACKKLVGIHDFSNLCKKSADKSNYVRTVHSAQISESEYLKGKSEFTIEANGFLWHQIRYIMSVLFLIGDKIYEPDVIDHLLDLEKCPEKSLILQYADGLPLTLYDSSYVDANKLQWHDSSKSNSIIEKKLQKLYHELSSKICILNEQMNVINKFNDSDIKLFDANSDPNHRKSHKKLAKKIKK